MQLVPLLAWSRVGETHDMAKVFEWMLREFLLANSGFCTPKGGKNGTTAWAKTSTSSFVPKGAFSYRKICISIG